MVRLKRELFELVIWFYAVMSFVVAGENLERIAALRIFPLLHEE